MSDNKEFGLFLKEELTKKSNLNSSQLASILHCSRSTLNDLFKGKRSLSKSFANRIETAFSSNSLSAEYSIKADDLLKKQAALIYKISGGNLNLEEDEDADTQSSQDKDYIDSSRAPSDEKFSLSNNTPESSNITTVQDQGLPFFAKFTKEKIECYVDNNQQECRGLIPELVYTLIATTASNEYLEKFYLPYGDDISLKGFDGIVIYNQNHPYIPKGYSVWEIGTNKDPKRKFDEDFSKAKEKLSKLSQDVDIHDVTYVAVFPRTISYQNKENWIRQKKKEGSEFKDIRIIDAFLLAQWANQSVSAQLHFSKQFSNFEEDDLLTNIETSQFMYKEMCFDRIEHGEELLNDLFRLYQNDYYDLFKSFIRTGIDGNILKAASESKILTKAFICYLAKIYDSDDKNIKSDNTVNAIEYQVNAALQYSEDKKQAKDTEFYGYEKSKYTNLFLNTYYIKDYKLLTKLISSLNVKSILIVDEEIIDFKIRELCRENQNIRIVAIRNSFPFDIMDSQDKAPSLVDELGFEDFFANSKKPLEEIELNPLPHYEIENTLTSFISRELKNRENKEGSHTNNSQAEHLDLNKFSHDKIRTLSYLSDGSLLNIKEILSNKGGATSSRLFIQQLKEQDINLNFLFCFCLMGKVNLDTETKFDVTVYKELLKDVITPDTDIETELNKIVNLKLHKGIARFHNRCYFATSRYITLNHLYKNSTVNKKTIISNLYAVVISLLKIKTRNGFVTSLFLDRNEFEDPVANSDLSSVNEYNYPRGCKGLNGEFNGDFRDNIDDRNDVSFLDYDNIRLDKEEKRLRKNIKKTYKNLIDNILENFTLHNYNLPLTAQDLSYDLIVTDGYTLLLKNLLDAICFFTKTHDMNVELQIYKYSSYLFRELKLDFSSFKESKESHFLIQKDIKQAVYYGTENLKIKVDATSFDTRDPTSTNSKKTTKRENILQVNEASDNNSFNKNDDIDNKVCVKDETSVQEESILEYEFFKHFVQLIGIAQCSEHLTIIDKESYFNFIQNEIPYFIEKAKSNDRYNCYVEDHPVYSSGVLYSILYIAQISLNSDFNKKKFKLSLELLLKLKEGKKIFKQRNVITNLDEVLDELFYVHTLKNEKDVDLRCKVLEDNLKIFPDTCKELLEREINNYIHYFPHHIRPSCAWIGLPKRYSISNKLFDYAVNSLLSVYLEILNNSLYKEKLYNTEESLSKYPSSSAQSKSNSTITGNAVLDSAHIPLPVPQESGSAEHKDESSPDSSSLQASSLSDNKNVSHASSLGHSHASSFGNDCSSSRDENSESDNKMFIDKIIAKDDFKSILYCVPFITQDSLNAVLKLVKICAVSATDDYKFELLSLFEKDELTIKKEFEKFLNTLINTHKKEKNDDIKEDEEAEPKVQYLEGLKSKFKVIQTFFNSVREVLEIKSAYLNHKWLIECCNTIKHVHKDKVPLKILEQYQDKGEDELYNYLSKLKTDYLFKILKTDGPKAILWILQNSETTFDLGRYLISSPKLSVNDRYNIFSFFIEALFKKNDELKLKSEQIYLRNCKFLLNDLSSVDNGFMLTRAFHDFVNKKNLSATEISSILLNLPCNEAVFNLADENSLTSDLYWKQVYINNPFDLWKNKELVNRIQISFTNANRLIDFVFYFRLYFEIDNDNQKAAQNTVKLATDCIREIVKELNSLYTKEYLKESLLTNSKNKGKLQTHKSTQVSQQAQLGLKNKNSDPLVSDEKDWCKECGNIRVSDNDIIEFCKEELFNRSKYAISSAQRQQYFSNISNVVQCLSFDSEVFTDFLKITLTQGNLSFNEKVIVELFILPFVMWNFRNSKEKEDLTKDINQYFSMNPTEFFRFFCLDIMQNYYEGVDNKSNFDAKLDESANNAVNSFNVRNSYYKRLNITCLYFTDRIYKEISPVPGYCQGQDPDSKEIEAWTKEILIAAQNTRNEDIIYSTNHRIAEILAQQKSGDNQLIPDFEICKAIENINNEDFIREFEYACHNDYSSRHVGFIDREGGSYKNKAIKFDNLLHKIDQDMYPRTYKIVKGIRDTYLEFSRRDTEYHLLRLYTFR